MELQPNKLSHDERREFDERNERIASGLAALRCEVCAVHDKKLWREDYASFEEWAGKRHGIGASHVYRIVRGDPPKQIAPTPEPEPEPPPEEKRAKKPEDVVPPSQPPPTEPPQPATPPPVPVVRDYTGYPIPEHRIPLFRRGPEVKPLLEKVAGIRGAIRRFMEAASEGRGDPLFSRTNLGEILTKLDSVYYEIKVAIPFAVCPDCQGQKSDPCLTCKGLGMISQHHWDTTISEEIKQIRKMSIAQ